MGTQGIHKCSSLTGASRTGLEGGTRAGPVRMTELGSRLGGAPPGRILHDLYQEILQDASAS